MHSFVILFPNPKCGGVSVRITRDTFAVFLPESIVSAGVVSGLVMTVAGPFPESGAAGNISGDGWGFFSLRYQDSGSGFEVIVSDVP